MTQKVRQLLAHHEPRIRFKVAEITNQACAMEGRQFVEAEGRDYLEVGRAKLREGWIQYQVRRQELTGNNRRDVRDQNFRDGTQRPRQQ